MNILPKVKWVFFLHTPTFMLFLFMFIYDNNAIDLVHFVVRPFDNAFSTWFRTYYFWNVFDIEKTKSNKNRNKGKQ